MSQFVEVKTAELSGPALDWAVAKATGWQLIPVPRDVDGAHSGEVIAPPDLGDDFRFPPRGKIGPCYFLQKWSTDWAQGGPLIDKYKPWISPPVNDPDPEQPYGWDAEIYDEAGFDVIGRAIGCPSNLIAICRAIVAAKLGDVVQVPAELIGVDA